MRVWLWLFVLLATPVMAQQSPVADIGRVLDANQLGASDAFAKQLAARGKIPYLSALSGNLSGQADLASSMAQGTTDWTKVDFGPDFSTLDQDGRFASAVANALKTHSVTFQAFAPIPGLGFEPAKEDTQKDVQGRIRVFGFPVGKDDPYADAVMLLGENEELCSGILVDPGHVLTAAHCACHHAVSKVVFGQSLAALQHPDKVITVVKIDQMIGCDAAPENGDLALATLEHTMNSVAVRPFASKDTLDKSLFVRLVGFGETRNGFAGKKLYTDAFIASIDCTGTVVAQGIGVGGLQDKDFYGCKPGSELVAGGLDRDTCFGDSGGPGYVFGPNAELEIAVATSRGVRGSETCGRGGIYSRLSDQGVLTWLQTVGVHVTVAQ